jgi:serine/threonine protein phosphatase PrpC
MTLTAKSRFETAIEIQAGARTDTGRIRENNEDSYRLAPELGLFVLSDGMGGLAAGELASRLTVDTIVEYCREAEGDPSLTFTGNPMPGVTEVSNRLADAIHLANRAVREAGKKRARDSNPVPMGATVVAARIIVGRLSLAHVGDSRAYRLRGGALEQLTQDHSFVAEQVRSGVITEQEAKRSNLQNVLTRALGVEPRVEVEILEELVLEGDTLLLCSDGLTRELSDSQIAAALGDGGDAEEAAGRLIDFANQAGGADNITAVVLRCGPKPTVGALGRVGRLGKWFKDSR